MSVSAVVFIVGAIFLAIGLIGGGITFGVKEGVASIPKMNTAGRILAFVIGLGFIGFGLWRDLYPSSPAFTPTATPLMQTITTPPATQISLPSTPVSVAPTNIASSTPVPQSPPTNAPNATSSVPATIEPSHMHIVNGRYDSIPGGRTWVCTGDFSTQINGIKKAWYDVGVSNTGLVFVLQPDSRFTISGPFEVPLGVDVGDCYPYFQDEKDSGISSAISAQFDRGCGSKCQYVNVIELDKDGNEVNNYWTPRKP